MLKFDIRKKKSFIKEKERKFLKLCFAYYPQWQKIMKFFEDKYRDSCKTSRKFHTIMKESLIKAFKLSDIKNGKFLFEKNKHGVFATLINKEIKIDFKEYKKYNHGKKDKNCPDFVFLSFNYFIIEIYFNDYEEIWEKITEREIFIIKKVVVYFFKDNLKYNDIINRRKPEDYIKFRNSLLYFQNRVIKSFEKSFYEENRLPENIKQIQIKEKFIITNEVFNEKKMEI